MHWNMGKLVPWLKEAIANPMRLTLEQIYEGKTTKIAVNRERIMPVGDTKKSKDEAVKKCETCKGRGMVVRMQQLGPGMYTQSQGPCDDCRGKGYIMDEKHFKMTK